MLTAERRVLVVDDDADYAEAQAEVLDMNGYLAKIAGSSEEALDITSTWPPQVALLDNNLGKDKGVDLIPGLKSLNPDVMCVLVTGFGTTDNAIQALRNGAVDFLRKPVGMPDILKCLDDCFERHQLRAERDQARRALDESEARLALAAQIARLGHWQWNIKTGKMLWSGDIQNLLDMAPGDLAENFESFLTMVHPDDRDRVRDALNEAVRDSGGYRFEHRLVTRDDRELFVEANARISHDDDGEPLVLTATVQDISERKQAAREQERLNAELRRRIEQIEDFADTASDWFWEMDSNLRYTYMSRDETVTGLPNEVDIIGKSRTEALAGRLPEAETADKHKWLDHEEVLNRRRPFGGFRYAIRLPDGSISHVSISGKPIFLEDGSFAGYRGTGTDITAAKESEEELERLARFDTLTNLPNRLLFDDRLDMALHGAQRHGRNLALMFIDLDRFKQINDSLGHKVGDAVLVAVAERLTSCVREVDTVSRLAGDEFTVILDGISEPGDIDEVARRIVASLAEPIAIAEHRIVSTASIGIAVFPDDGQDAQTLVHHADQAMYAAKGSSGGAYRYYSAAMSRGVQQRLKFESDLRKALAQEQFELHYQPRVDAEQGRVTGAEALLRWRHPERGLVPPLDFIPTAEKTGLIVPIGRYVINEVCRQAKAWHREQCFDGAISLNISARQLAEDSLIDDIRGALETWELPAEFLEIELTESVVMDSTDESVDVLGKLRDLGLKVSLDDFGTGYSSLAYLRHLPVDTLKIDRSFVREIDAGESSSPLVNGILSIAESMNLTVVAEGVETAEQSEALQRRGCHDLQGYFFSHPVTAAGFPAAVADINNGRYPVDAASCAAPSGQGNG